MVQEFVCDIDGKKFQKRSKFSLHQQTHDNVTYNCTICYKQLKTKDGLEIHIKIHSGNLKEIQCNECNKTFFHQSGLRQHKRSIHEGKQFACVQCGKDFSRKAKLKLHFRKCKFNREKNENSLLEKQLSDDADSLEHVNENYQSNFVNFTNKEKCLDCDLYYKSKESLKAHVYDVHTSIHNRTCIMCKQVFKTVKGMKKHMKVAHPFFVHGSFPNQNNSPVSPAADEQLDNNQETTAAIQCYQCKIPFSNRRNLNKHKRKYHTINNFNCDKCNEAFTQKIDFKTHKATCESEFKCIICEKVFPRKDYLKKHQEKTHRPNIYTITDLLELQEGKNAHYRCDQCGMYFTERRSFVRHNRRFHEESNCRKRKAPIKSRTSRKNMIMDTNAALDCVEKVVNNDVNFGKKILKKIMKNHKEISTEIAKEQLSKELSMTPVQENALLSQTHISIHGMRVIKRGLRRIGAVDPFTSVNKYMEEKKKLTEHINENNFYIGNMDLEKTKQGLNKRKVCDLPVVHVINVLDYILEIVNEEEDELCFDNDDEELSIVLVGDLANFMGDGRNHTSFCLYNKPDEAPIKIHCMVLAAASDSVANTKVTHKKLLPQIKEINGKSIFVNGVKRNIRFKTCVDMKCEDTWIQTSTSRSTQPDNHTNVTLSHLENHGGRPHGPKFCPEIKYNSIDDHKENFNWAMVANNGKLENLKHKDFNSVMGSILIEMKDIKDYHPATRHVISGVAEALLRIGRRTTQLIDLEDDPSLSEDARKNLEEEIQTNEQDIVEINRKLENYSFAKFTLSNDKARHDAQIQGDFPKAKEIATKLWHKTKLKVNKPKEDCGSLDCIIQPIDELADNVMKIQCSKGGHWVHYRDEAIVKDLDSVTTNEEESYLCLLCSKFSVNDLPQHFDNKSEQIGDEIRNLECELATEKIRKNKLQQKKINFTGKRETKWIDDLKKTKITTQKYFGGEAMTWNVVNNLYKNVKERKFTFLQALRDKPEIYRQHVELWKILARIDEIVSMKNPSTEQLEEGAGLCELICELFPVFFPKENITRKMHVLSFVLPSNLREGTVYKFLKIEQKSENLHVDLNQAEKNYLTTKNHAQRLFSMLKHVERKLRAKKRCPELQEQENKAKKVYNPEKSVSCDICDKTFAHKGALSMHMKSHKIN